MSPPLASTITPGASGDGGETFHLILKTLTGKSIPITVSPDASFGDVKRRVQEIEGIPLDQQRLIYSGIQLYDEETLRGYNLPSGCIIHLLLRLRD